MEYKPLDVPFNNPCVFQGDGYLTYTATGLQNVHLFSVVSQKPQFSF